MRVSVNFDLKRFARSLDAIHTKQLPYATARALTDVAIEARDRITAELPSIFDRPTPFTEKAFTIKSATKGDLTSVVFARPIQAKYLLHEEIGGERLPSENTRIAATALVLPGKIERDQFGNIPSGAIKALRQAVNDEETGKVRRTRAAKAIASAKAAREKLSYLSGQGIAYIKGKGPLGGPGGFFMRLPGHHITRLTAFEGMTSYKPRFHYRDRVTAIVGKAFKIALVKRLAEAISSSKS